MATYKSLSALLKAAQTAAKATLNNEVAELVKQEISEAEQELVYGSYSPVMYARRNSLGKGFTVQPTGAFSIRIWDNAPSNYSVFGSAPAAPGYFAQWINDGNVLNVFNTKTYPWMSPRPFYDQAIANLAGSKIQQVAANGIKRRL